MEEFEADVTEVTIVPSRGGVFEVTVDDELVFSKKRAGRHAEFDEILGGIRKLQR